MLQPGMVRGQYGANMIGQPNGVAMNNDMKRPMPNTRNAYVDLYLICAIPRHGSTVAQEEGRL